jgi:NDP-sugar pyrophosphorylase family protein
MIMKSALRKRITYEQIHRTRRRRNIIYIRYLLLLMLLKIIPKRIITMATKGFAMPSHLQSPHYFDLETYEHAAIFDNCRYVWEALKNLDAYLKNCELGNIRFMKLNEVFIENPSLISIGEGTIVEPGAFIRGPCKIGKNCTIRHGAYIRGGVLTGDDCVIGHDTELKNVIFLNKVHAVHFAYVGDSILGHRVNLGAGTKCANLKLDGSPIVIQDQGKRIETGLRKFGAILGDDVQTGCNSVVNPGTLVGKGIVCYPCVTLSGVIPSNSLVKTQEKLVISSRR